MSARGEDDALRLVTELNSTDAAQRATAVRALQQSPDPRALPGLIRCLHDYDWQLREEAAIALGRSRDRRATAALVEALGDYSGGDAVQELAALALGEIGDSDAIPALLEAVEKGDEAAHAAARQALARIPGAREAVNAALASVSALRRRAAVEALAAIGDESSVGAVAAQLGDVDPDVRQAAARALGEIKADSAPAHLARALEDPAFEVRAEAAGAAGALPEESGQPLLSRALGDSHWYVRQRAVRGLKTQTTSRLELLQRAVNDAAAEVREDAAYGLAYYEHGASGAMAQQALALLRSAMGDSEPRVRARACAAVQGFRESTEAAELLSLAFDDSDAFVRRHAAWSAGQRGDKSLVERLLITLCDPVADVRVAALRGLGDLYASGVAEPMAALLKDENPLVRAAAASALRSVPVARGRGLIMAVLEASLQDEDSEVRKEVSESLRYLSR